MTIDSSASENSATLPVIRQAASLINSTAMPTATLIAAMVPVFGPSRSPVTPQSAIVSTEAKLSAGPPASNGVVTSTKVSG